MVLKIRCVTTRPSQEQLGLYVVKLNMFSEPIKLKDLLKTVSDYQTQDALLSLVCESGVRKFGRLINTTRETDFAEYYN